jgi:plasmid maintenance system antidote protein VapI
MTIQDIHINELVKKTGTPSDFIKKLMEDKGLTASDVAFKMRISPSQIRVMLYYLRTGIRTIRPETCVKLARTLGIDPYILNRVIGDYSIKQYLKSKKK